MDNRKRGESQTQQAINSRESEPQRHPYSVPMGLEGMNFEQQRKRFRNNEQDGDTGNKKSSWTNAGAPNE